MSIDPLNPRDPVALALAQLLGGLSRIMEKDTYHRPDGSSAIGGFAQMARDTIMQADATLKGIVDVDD